MINYNSSFDFVHLSGIESASGEDSSGIDPASGEDSSDLEPASGIEFGSGAGMF